MICSMISRGFEILPVQKAFQRLSIWLLMRPVIAQCYSYA